jgi:predicted PurR-regulated permease PerM
MQNERSSDLVRVTLQLLALGALISTSLWIIRPFLVAIVWATAVAVSTWPLLLHAQASLRGRRSLAVAVMTLAIVLILILPFYFAVTAITGNIGAITDWSKSLATATLPQPPAWIRAVPIIGLKLATGWQQLAAASHEELLAHLEPVVRTGALWFVSQIGNIGLLFVQLVLTVVITAIFYSNGETVGGSVLRFARRLVGPDGEQAVQLAAQAIRGVALGIVVTAALQSVLAGIALAVAGVPFAILLTAMMFILAVAQIGPVPVLIGAVVWVYSRSGPIWGTGLLIWAVFCGTFDNFLRPVLIRRGADLPLMLIFVGVVGGLLAFGIIGLFIGPAVLAVAHSLFVEWMYDKDQLTLKNSADS